MSYDIWLTADLGGPEPIRIDGEMWNYTSNCSRMWREAGADLAEFDGKQAGECAEVLRAGLVALLGEPDKYRAMDPSNGWGSYDSMLKALLALLASFERAPKATVRVWR